jgi:hypothetical protein
VRGNSTTSLGQPNSIMLYSLGNQSMTYSTALTGGIGAGAYSVHIIVERVP